MSLSDEQNPLSKQSTHLKQVCKHVHGTKDDRTDVSLHVREGNTDHLFVVENTDATPHLCPGMLICEVAQSLIRCQCMLHFLRTERNIKTLRDCAEKQVIPFTDKHLAAAKCVDVTWDRQHESNDQRESREAGVP